jgi:excisionase family DNA binding protein
MLLERGTTMPEDILTIREVAEYLKVTERTLYRLVQEGQLPAFKVGNSWRFRRDDLERWISKQARTTRTTRKEH